MHELYYHTLEPYSKHRMQKHFLDTDSFVFRLDANNQQLSEFLQQNKDEFDFSELDKNHEFNDFLNKKTVGKMKI